MLRLTFICALLLLQTLAVFSAGSNDAVLERMAAVKLFAFGGVGFAGVTSPGESDFRTILARPSAESDFEKLLALGNTQAQSYALVGLRRLNPGKFTALAAPLRSSKQNVATMLGCISSQEPMAALIGAIEQGSYSY